MRLFKKENSNYSLIKKSLKANYKTIGKPSSVYHVGNYVYSNDLAEKLFSNYLVSKDISVFEKNLGLVTKDTLEIFLIQNTQKRWFLMMFIFPLEFLEKEECIFIREIQIDQYSGENIY